MKACMRAHAVFNTRVVFAVNPSTLGGLKDVSGAPMGQVLDQIL
jgi:hypothetical protein